MLNRFVQTVFVSQQIMDFCGALVLEGHSVCCNSLTFNTLLFSNSLTGKWFNVFTLISGQYSRTSNERPPSKRPPV